MRFAHLGDCHLGSWRQPELQELNFRSFQQAVDICIQEKVEFMLLTGDLFDSAYPPVEILKETFAEFRKIKEAGIRCFMIAGSHDYSVSGRTFLDVLEKAGFAEICRHDISLNENGEIENISLLPIKYKGFEIYGYPGKKSGLEVQDLKKIEVPESNNFRILMLHTSLKEAVGDLPIESISIEELPKAEYYALAHLHIDFNQKKDNSPVIYSGPIFPNSFQELEDLGKGSFYVVDVEGYTEPKKKEIKLNEIVTFSFEIENALTATKEIIGEFEKHDLKNKLVLLRLHGIIQQGTNADIDYAKIKEYLEEKEAYSFLKNTHKLSTKKEQESSEIELDVGEMGKIEETLIKEYELKNPNKFNNQITQLIHSLDLQKQEDEKSVIFESRLFSELNKILKLEIK